MTRQQKIRAFERRGYSVVINYNSVGRATICIRYPYGWRFYNSVNDAYNHRSF